MNAIKKLLESLGPAQRQQVEKLMIFLNPETEEEKTQAVALLSDLVGLETKELAFTNKELETASRGKEFSQPLVRELRARSGRHPLAGMLGGPSGAEGGPAQAQVVSKERARDITGLVLKELAEGKTTVQVTEKVVLQRAPFFLRVTLKESRQGPAGFTEYPIGVWSKEVSIAPDNVSGSIAEALAAACQAEACEQAIEEPARHSWQFAGMSQPTSKVITGPGG